jgi:plasmid maintenance system killer protein
MRLLYSERFRESFEDAPLLIQQTFERKVVFLLQNLHHPSLHAKKYDESRGIWQARVNKDWRFYFTIEDDAYFLIDIVTHPQ